MNMTHEDQDNQSQPVENGICKQNSEELSESNVLTLGSLNVPTTAVVHNVEPIVHPPVDAPLCSNCQQLDLEFFDPSCPGCREILNDPNTSIAQIFACMRQWVPQTQRNIEGLVDHVLKRGANVNDRDGLTDMTLLHFACKAGACGVGDAAAATRTVQALLAKGANVNLRCKWTQMASLHYAAYFDAAPIVQLLLERSPEIDINATCVEYNKGTALHIAASNLCYETAQILLQYGARLNIRDALGRTPKDCVPSAEDFNPIPHVQETVAALKQLLASQPNGSIRNGMKSLGEPVSGRALLKSMDLNYGSRVLVAGVKSGTLRFCGTTEFAVGLWIGVELDAADGKNNGSINGVVYFKCSPNHGIFVPINKISKYNGASTPNRKTSSRMTPASTPIKHTKLDFSKVTSKIETGLTPGKLLPPKTPDRDLSSGLFAIGDRILVGGKRKGTIRYYGPTKFSPGNWYGIELDLCDGKNDGSVQGVRYFVCSPNRGVFSHPSRVSKLLTASDEGLFELDTSGAGSSNGGTNGIRTMNGSPENGAANSALLSPFKRSTYHASFRIKTPTRSPRKVSRQLDVTLSPSTSTNGCCLTLGVNALVNNELGVVKYIGPVDFAEGTWIGIELRLPHGKNSGTVNGKQYFSCRPNHGFLVRPNKVSVHGINGSKLLEEH